MPKAIRVRVVERFDNYDNFAGYMYSLKEDNIKSRISRVNKKWKDCWEIVIIEGPKDVDITEKLYKALARDPTASLWCHKDKSREDLT